MSNLRTSAKEALEGGQLGRMLACYLVSGYAYYHCDVGLLEDDTFDKIGKALHDRWDELDHPHKHLVSKADLAAGTLYALRRDQYPMMVRVCAYKEIENASATAGSP